MVDNFKRTDIGIIPNDWDVHELGNVAQFRRGSFPQPYGLDIWYDVNNGMPFIQVYDVDDNMLLKPETKQKISDAAKSKSVFVGKGTIILTIQGSIGRIAITQYDSYVDRTLLIFQSYKKPIDKWFFMYVVYQLFQIEKAKAPGGTIKTITKKELSNFLIPLPPTKDEQTSIANAIKDADALINQLEQLLTKKRDIKTGAMQELLKPKKDWEEKILGEVATLKARIGWQGLTTSEYRKTGNYFLITGTEFKNGFIDWESCFYVDEERYKQDKNIQVKEHDVLVTKDGTIGKIALIKSVPQPATLNSGVFVIRPIANSFQPEFFYYLLLSEVFSIFLSQLSAGSTISHLYQKDFVTFKFLQPKTIDEQKEIANILFDMDTEIQELERKLEKYKMLKQGMMQSLLTGKIRLL